MGKQGKISGISGLQVAITPAKYQNQVESSNILKYTSELQMLSSTKTVTIAPFSSAVLSMMRNPILLLLCCLIPSSVMGQEKSANDGNSIDALQKKFNEIQEEFRSVVYEAQHVGVTYLNEPTVDAADPYLDEFDKVTTKGNKVLERWISAGMELFEAKLAAGDEVEDDLIYFVTKIMARKFERYQFPEAFKMADRLVKLNPENLFAEVYRARAGLLTNQFGTTVSYSLERNKEHLGRDDFLSDTEVMMVNNVYFLRDEFEKEELIREKEAAADDLPRVKFVTNKGEFVIELFENEAPETVGNFINLVESGHYDGLIFHTVIHHTAAETGKLDEDLELRPVGYNIYDEYEKPDARKIFAGSVVMNNGGEIHKGNSAFFVSLGSLVQLNGTQTVFGRVLSGMDSVYKLNITHEIVEKTQRLLDDADPDKIISATVLRKRNHEYKPRKVSKN